MEALYAADSGITRDRIEKIHMARAGVRVIEMPGANHYIFIANQGEVIRGLRAFLAALPAR
jgi:hypothetical protein